MTKETKSVHKVVRTESKKDIVRMRGMFLPCGFAALIISLLLLWDLYAIMQVS